MIFVDYFFLFCCWILFVYLGWGGGGGGGGGGWHLNIAFNKCLIDW